ncbi:MAG: hypothetical protein IKQ46_01870 [Bacteroidales bacterium]|nr:hypothetical protein [Bacteroidales bacterium]
MKRHFLIILLLAVVGLCGCSSGEETKLIGTWVLSDIDYINLDKRCEVLVQHTKLEIDNRLMMINAELDSLNLNSDHKLLQKKRASLLEEKNNINEENFKKMYEAVKEQLEGHFQYKFTHSQKYFASSDNETKEGSWEMRNDTIFTTHEGQDADVLIVKELTNSKLVFEVETATEVPLVRVLTFKKK